MALASARRLRVGRAAPRLYRATRRYFARGSRSGPRVKHGPTRNGARENRPQSLTCSGTSSSPSTPSQNTYCCSYTIITNRRTIPPKGTTMPIFNAPHKPTTANAVPTSPNAAAQGRTQPNRSNTPDRRRNLKKPENPRTHDLQQYIEDRLRIPLFQSEKKVAENPKVLRGCPKHASRTNPERAFRKRLSTSPRLPYATTPGASCPERMSR